MRVLVSPTAFKGTFSPIDAAQAIAHGWSGVRPEDDLRILPVADGGDGTVDVLVSHAAGSVVEHVVDVPDAMGGLGRTSLYALEDGTALVSVASACGMVAMRGRPIDPLRASTRAVGALVRKAADLGCWRVVLALGGSASTDAGVGAAHELGARFFDTAGVELDPHPAGLSKVARVTVATPPIPVIGLVDVPGPLTGPTGAARMFARQKGATDAEIDVLERYLTRLSSCVDLASAALPGAVAGGGLGWSVAALLGGSLVPGAQYVAESVGLDAAIGWAHVIVVGEGRIDRQTILGKSVADVARRARVTGTMCLAAVGETHLDPMSSEALGLDLVVADPEPDRAGAALASYYSSTLTPERVIL